MAHHGEPSASGTSTELGATRAVARPGLPTWRETARVGAALFAAASSVGALTLGLLLPREERRAFESWGERLAAIAGASRLAIDSWVEERLADARVVAAYPTVRALLAIPAPAPADPVALAHVGEIVQGMTRSHPGLRVLILDATGVTRLDSTAGSAPDEACRERVRRLTPGETAVEAHRLGGAAVMHFVAAVVSSSGKPDRVTGAVMLETPLGPWLRAELLRPPAASATAETMLARREGDEAVFLGPLRHAPSGLRVPLDRPRFAMSLALDGRDSVTRAVDYRGVPVLAVTRRLRSQPWGLVVKVDEAEVLAPVRRTATAWVAAATGLAATLAGLGALVWIRRRTRQVLAFAADLESRVERRTAELRAASEELEAFSYSVSHDLRTPLRAIDGFSRILDEDYGPRLDDEARRLITVIRASTTRMGLLIDDLLAFSRLGREALRPQRVDMKALAQDAFRELRDGAGEVDLRLGDLPEAWGDPRLLKQIWLNLLGNAVKFTAGRPVRRVEVEGRLAEGSASYRVRDNGAGFDMEYAGKLFHVFRRLHRTDEFQGTGIGLALVRRIVEKHGGTVEAEGRVGEGATFGFCLPTREGKEA